MKRHTHPQPLPLGSNIAPLVAEHDWVKSYVPFPPLPVHTERCANCSWPSKCEQDMTCWKDPSITLERKRIEQKHVPQNKPWTYDEAVRVLKLFRRTTGRPPTIQDTYGNLDLPSLRTCQRLFGSWAHALRAAGMEPRRWNRK